MDDLEFRRKLYASPQDLDKDTQDAIAADPAKARFADDMLQFDQEIAKAMKIDAPDQLKERLILRQTLFQHRLEKRRARRHIAIAASVAFAVGVGLTMLNTAPTNHNIADYALAHLHHEISLLDKDDGNVSLTKVNAKLMDFSVQMSALPGRIIAADYCRFDGIQGLHILLDDNGGKYTVFVFPKDRLLESQPIFGDNEFLGLTSAHGDIQLVVIGKKDEPVADVSKQIQDTLNWTI